MFVFIRISLHETCNCILKQIKTTGLRRKLTFFQMYFVQPLSLLLLKEICKEYYELYAYVYIANNLSVRNFLPPKQV